jgi:hypothetical protein
MTDGGGECHSIHYLERKLKDRTAQYVIHIDDFDERLTFSVLRSVCDRLEIDRTKFGLTLE